jgi:hypothetical protein
LLFGGAVFEVPGGLSVADENKLGHADPDRLGAEAGALCVPKVKDFKHP